MRKEIEINETTVFEEIVTLNPPAKVFLPALTDRMVGLTVQPLESLYKIARRISQISATTDVHKEVSGVKKTSFSPSELKIESGKQQKQKVYQRLKEAFD